MEDLREREFLGCAGERRRGGFVHVLEYGAYMHSLCKGT